MNPTAKFIQNVIETYSSGHAREHSYRPALKELFEDITDLKVINEPKRSEYGAPDFVFLKPTSSKEKVIIAYAEAKDININLADIERSEQMDRYYGYSNIILTNGLEFRFYKNTTSYSEPIVIGKLEKEKIVTFDSSFKLLEDTIRDFIKESKEPIKSGTVLAKIMAGKARRIRDNIKIYLKNEDDIKNQNLLEIYEVIKRTLLVDLDKEKFSDMYSQTLVYGLFVARYYDTTGESFSRQEARDLVPASNPFLRHFFDHIAGASFDPRIEMIVNELCEEFTHADVKAIIHNYYKVEKESSRDPIIHFYEDFLQEYDIQERKNMGVFYTPLPVVRFIIRSVDDILKTDFGVEKGLTDNSKIEIKRTIQGKTKNDSVHRVQILDPATGTGTFLNEAILHINKSFVGQEGRWNSYVNNDLLPRLHGFEIMMASYTIAHLKLSSTIIETGAKIENSRLGVYLTNSLEKGEVEEENLFSFGLGKAITDESRDANKVKNELPIMVVMGNPPYNISSQNKGKYISDLLKEYKKDLNERKINLDDDYIKFIRFTENIIENNKEGIIGMITNNSFIDGITHRQMRKHLLETFDSIYIVDLHGNSKKKEKNPNGGPDENVFAIQQGVSISIFVKKNGKKKGLGTVYHTDLYGKQKDKFSILNESSIESIKWNKLDYQEPYYFFVPKDFGASKEYDKGFKLNDLFGVFSVGIGTKVDSISVDFDKNILQKRVLDILENKYSKADLIKRFELGSNTTWEYEKALTSKFADEKLSQYDYRPFDSRYVFYDKNFLSRNRGEVMDNFFNRDNIALELGKTSFIAFVSRSISDEHFGGAKSYKFPLYLYTVNDEKIPNLKEEIVAKIENTVGEVTPENILDYIYSVLYSTNYRSNYKEFLKIDFPKIPYPKNKEVFWKLAGLGEELRNTHLLKSPDTFNFITTFHEQGTDILDNKYPKYKDNNVYINDNQYFGNVPESVWVYYIGGYQPAQKWLKDRKGRRLSNEDIEHYQKIITSLSNTEKIVGEIDNIV